MRQRPPAGSRALAATVVALVLAAACGGGEPATRTGGTLTVRLPADVDSWNPYTTRNASAAGIVALVYPNLMRERPDGSFEPWLAASWSFDDERRQLTFRLRDDARWSNGRTIDCEDVRFTLRIQTDPALAWSGASTKERIEGVDCPEPGIARFRLREAHADVLLDVNDNAIVPREYGDVPLSDWGAVAWEDRLVSAGPFRVAAVRPGQEIELERDPLWWGEPAHLERVVLRVHPDAAQAQIAFRAGELDVYPGLDPLRAAELRDAPGVDLRAVPSRSYTFVGWNQLEPRAYAEDRARRGCDDGCAETVDDLRRLRAMHPHPILADARVRRALGLAIDRRDLTDGLWSGYARPAGTPIVSGLWAHRDGLTPPFDPARAEALLDEAGWTRRGDGVRERADGQRLELVALAYADNATRTDALQRVAASLRRIGVEIRIEAVPRGAFIRRAWGKEFDAVISAWRAGTRVEPQTLFHSRAAVERGNNFVSWWTEASDDLLDRAAAAATREAAGPLWHEWQGRFAEERPYAILYERDTLVGLGPRVRGAQPTALNALDGLHRWWIDSGS